MNIIKYFLCNENAKPPSKAHEDDAGWDVCAASEGSIAPRQRRLIKTGLKFEIPTGWEIQIRPRSGLALKHGIVVLNAPSTIDAHYTGEIGILLINHGDDVFNFDTNTRIAQLVPAELSRVHFVETKLEPTSEKRGDKGWGSSG